MDKTLTVAIAILAGLTWTAMAQVTTSQTTTTTTPSTVIPSIIAPPAGTLSTSRQQTVVGPDGRVTKTDETTYRNSLGVADDKTTTTTTPAPAVTTTTTTRSKTTTTP